MNIDQYYVMRSRLFKEVGKERTEKIVDEITQIIRSNNLDVTPTTLSEILTYVEKTIQLQRI